MARTLVVDLGGVLLRWDPPALLAEAWPDLVPDRAAARALTSEVFQGGRRGGDWGDFDRGALDRAALVGRMSTRLGLPAQRVHDLLEAIPAHLRIQPPTARLLDRVRAGGVRLVYLSNMPAPYADRLDALPQFAAWFDGGVYSARIGHAKPEPQIYAEAQQRLALDPEPASTLLLDDRPDNVAAAVRHGWAGVVFTDAEDAEAQLAARGWLG